MHFTNKAALEQKIDKRGRKDMKMNEINLKKWGGTEQYLKPQMEVIDLSGEDVVVTSGCTPLDSTNTNLCTAESIIMCPAHTCPTNRPR